MEKQRARNPAEKEYRKQSIVDALEGLLERSLHPLPSANEIARAAGVTKGVIYFYFDTREEIFLTLLLQLGRRVFQRIDAAMQAETPYDHTRVRAELIEACVTNPVFMHLGSLAPGILETNASTAFSREFKLASARQFEEFAVAFARQTDDIDVDRCRRFFLRFYYMALALWQHHHPAEAVLAAFPDERPWILQGELKQELEESFDWLWAGMRASAATVETHTGSKRPGRS